MMRFLPLLFSVIAPALACAQEPPPELALPVDCTPGVDCWIPLYVDVAEGLDAQDYQCGKLSYDGHNGTDFAVRDLAAVAAGVAVRAAADGIVIATRDEVMDGGSDVAPAGQECGNGVRLAHGTEWETQYCHLRRGSIVVQPGDRVRAGEEIGSVGLSGQTTFPHVELVVRRGGEAIDPFRGPGAPAECGVGKDPLWSAVALDQLAYRPVLLVNAGFAPGRPVAEDARRGWLARETMPATAPALVLWFDAYWTEPGDRVRFELRGPDGATVLDQAFVLDDAHKQWFGFAGARRPADRWPAGAYSGTVTLEGERPTGPQRLAIERAIVLE